MASNCVEARELKKTKWWGPNFEMIPKEKKNFSCQFYVDMVDSVFCIPPDSVGMYRIVYLSLQNVVVQIWGHYPTAYLNCICEHNLVLAPLPHRIYSAVHKWYFTGVAGAFTLQHGLPM
jgi:hypothetical protein